MKRFILGIACCLPATGIVAQATGQKIKKAYAQFEADPQLKNAISSLYVIDAKTGETVFEKNSRTGLAPASTQKIITATTAFALLGRNFRYRTDLSYLGTIRDGVLTGSLYLKGNGDPTLGSWRYNNTKPGAIRDEMAVAFRKQKINSFNGSITAVSSEPGNHSIPDGWIWQDIGNYYGAPAGELNWNENQFDLVLKPGNRKGDTVKMVRTNPDIENLFINELKTGQANSGDNGYIYFEPGTYNYYARGTVPCCVDSFIISGAVTNSKIFTLNIVAGLLPVSEPGTSQAGTMPVAGAGYDGNESRVSLYTHYSPSLDSIVYWLLKKSINLYGEALISTIGYEKNGARETANGVAVLVDYWKQRGIEPGELNMYDGSGLSPLNRITTHAQVEILKYASRQNWFTGFYDALPQYNSMKLKSGTISDVKGFCGYHTSKDGKEYIISFLVNNYNGASSALVNKMYRVLDILK